MRSKHDQPEVRGRPRFGIVDATRLQLLKTRADKPTNLWKLFLLVKSSSITLIVQGDYESRYWDVPLQHLAKGTDVRTVVLLMITYHKLHAYM